MLDDFFKEDDKEPVNINQKYPVIWKIEKCLLGECKDQRTSHRWSIPFSAAEGLVTECYDCHKTRVVKVG